MPLLLSLSLIVACGTSVGPKHMQESPRHERYGRCISSELGLCQVQKLTSEILAQAPLGFSARPGCSHVFQAGVVQGSQEDVRSARQLWVGVAGLREGRLVDFLAGNYCHMELAVAGPEVCSSVALPSVATTGMSAIKSAGLGYLRVANRNWRRCL